jgi:hypothetical protein
MAATRKAAVDPLIEELSPGQESKPDSPDDVVFDVQISPYVVGGKHYFRWEILNHSYKSFAGDHSGRRDAGFYTQKEAEDDAKRHIVDIRAVVELKLNAPGSYVITI